VLSFLGLFAFKLLLTIGFAASLAVKEFNSKTNICSTTTMLFLKRALVVCLGLLLVFLVILILSLTLSPHYFEHILEVDSVKKYDIQSFLKCRKLMTL
jgi:hypothetical protein